ncbi:MAG TPA: thioredoxin-like domain-containing protein, partial [Planctomycetota bacterium]|nr:thioredoxin-like domain-containing protein [Planctomycetota bacterium]
MPPKGIKVLIFAGTACPMSNAKIPRLIELASKYPQAEFALVNSNRNESADEVADHARKFGWSHAAVKDADHVLANRYGVERVPTAVVLQDGRVRYKGRIDDHKSEEFVKSSDLARALEELAAGLAVSVQETPVEGCVIARRARAVDDAVTYARDAAPILNRHCVSCHQPGGAGPVSFADYATASAWASNIKSAVTEGRMPPWKPVSNHGMYHNERRLPKEEVETLARWADAGAPAGDLSAAPAPPIKAGGGWLLGEPDAVLKVDTPFEVEAKGRDVYRCYVLRTDFGGHKWVAAVEYRVGNPRVVHHILSYLDTLGQAQAKDRSDEG